MTPFSLIEAASSSRDSSLKFRRGLRGLGRRNSIGIFCCPRVGWMGAGKSDRIFLLAAGARGGGERLRAAKQGGKTAPEPRRRSFGGFMGFNGRVSRVNT